MTSKTSSSSYSRPLPGGVGPLILAAMTFQVMQHLPDLWNPQQKSWLPHTINRIAEQAQVLDEDTDEINQLLLETPGTGSLLAAAEATSSGGPTPEETND